MSGFSGAIHIIISESGGWASDLRRVVGPPRPCAQRVPTEHVRLPNAAKLDAPEARDADASLSVQELAGRIQRGVLVDVDGARHYGMEPPLEVKGMRGSF